MTAIASNAFVGCSGLFEVELPPSIETIGPSAFGQNEALTAVTLPESLTEMGVGAFDAANNLRSIRIPSAVTEMGVGVFHNCKHLGDVFFARARPPEAASEKRVPGHRAPIRALAVVCGGGARKRVRRVCVPPARCRGISRPCL